MRRTLVLVFVLTSLVTPQPAVAGPPEIGVVRNFGPNLAAHCRTSEGIAVDPRGNVYVSSAASQPTVHICVLDRHGDLVRTIPVMAGTGGVVTLLGMLYVQGEGLYVGDLASGAAPHGRVLRVDPRSGSVSTVATGFAAPNAIARDPRGRLYVSDSFRGSITRIDQDGGSTTRVYADLLPAGSPPFGANGVAFDRNARHLYVSNTSTDRIYRIAVDRGVLGAIELFADGGALGGGALNGADGIAFDARQNLYVAANQANQIHALSPSGALIARYAGTGPTALIFPASLAFKGRDLFVANADFFAGGAGSKLSVITVRHPGAPLH